MSICNTFIFFALIPPYPAHPSPPKNLHLKPRRPIPRAQARPGSRLRLAGPSASLPLAHPGPSSVAGPPDLPASHHPDPRPTSTPARDPRGRFPEGPRPRGLPADPSLPTSRPARAACPCSVWPGPAASISDPGRPGPQSARSGRAGPHLDPVHGRLELELLHQALQGAHAGPGRHGGGETPSGSGEPGSPRRRTADPGTAPGRGRARARPATRPRPMDSRPGPPATRPAPLQQLESGMSRGLEAKGLGTRPCALLFLLAT